MNLKFRQLGAVLVGLLAGAALPALAQTVPSAHDAVPVTIDNFARAESDMYFSMVVKQGGFGKFRHYRDLFPVDRQTAVRPNRDTIYSSGIFDLDAGPVTVKLPEAGKRFRSFAVINEDHYVPLVAYGNGPYTITRKQAGTRYAMLVVRALADPRDPADMKALHAEQDAIVVTQASPGTFEVPNWDRASQKTMHDALIALGDTLPDLNGAFGIRGKVSPVRHLIGTALAWGGNPDKDSIYLNIKPRRNDGKTIYRLRVTDVPVDGFWSISVYNARGFIEPNPHGIYTLNNIVAKKDADGAVSVQFGGCEGGVPNCLPVPADWNYMVRLYLPRAQVLDGRWKFPEAVAVE